MNDIHLEEQLVNELKDMLRKLNETYEGYYHFQLLTLVDMKEDACLPCNEDPFKPKCLRSVIGFEKKEEDGIK